MPYPVFERQRTFHEKESPGTRHAAPSRLFASEILWLIAAIAGIVAAVLAHLQRLSLMPAMRGPRVIWAEYLFAGAAAMALLCMHGALGRRLRLGRLLELPGLPIPIAAVLAFFVARLGMHQFGGWDEGLIVHAATYYQHGFRPFVDFPCSMPPFFMAGIRFAALVLGMKWSSFALLSAMYAALTFLWMYWLMLAAGLPRRWALALSLAVELSTMFVEPFWWYNNTTSLAAVLLLVNVAACLRNGTASTVWISLAGALGLVLTAKPNAALALPMAAILFLGKDCGQRRKALLSGIGGVCAAWLICHAAQLPVEKLLHAYAEVGKLRGNPLAMLPIHQLASPERQFTLVLAGLVFAIAVAALISAWRRNCASRYLVAACALAVLTSVEMTATNATIKVTDLCLAVVPIVLLREGLALRKPGRFAVAGILSLFAVLPCYFGLLHIRILEIGYGRYYQSLPTEMLHGGFFNGLEASPCLVSVQQQVQDALNRYPSQRVLFGPRMEMEYAAFQREPLPGIPLLWDTGILYSRERIPELFQTLRGLDPQLIVLRKHDATGMDAIILYLRASGVYQLVDDYSEITLLVHRPNAPFANADMRFLMEECERAPGCVKRF